MQLSTEAARVVRQAAPRLGHHRIFQSRNLEAAHGFLNSKDFRLNFSRRDDSAVDVHINGFYMPSIFLGHFCYGRAMALEVKPARTDYWFQFPSHGRFTIDVNKQQICCDDASGAVLSPSYQNTIIAEPGCGRVALSLTHDAMVQALSAMLGVPIARPLEFRPSVRLGSGYGRSLVAHVRAGIEDLEQSDSLLSSARSACVRAVPRAGVAAESPAQLLRSARARPTPAVASRDVKRAIDFIEGNIAAPIAIPDIVAASAVSGRALFKHFRRFTGSSPMQYVREARLRRVRDALLSAQPDEHIASIAARWGFSHPGRFASDYRRRFGETPLDTKRRPRQDALRLPKSIR